MSGLTGGPWSTALGEHLPSFLMPLLEVRYPPLLLLLLLVLQAKVCAEFPGAGFHPARTSRILRMLLRLGLGGKTSHAESQLLL